MPWVPVAQPERSQGGAMLTQEEKKLGKTLKKNVHLTPEELTGVNTREGLIQLLSSKNVNWSDLEPYKTVDDPKDYAEELPRDIVDACTPSAAMNHFIRDLLRDGYVHNHAHMYLAAYVVHFRRIK